MSVEALAVALNHSRATGTDKVVMLGICNHDGDGGAWPSVATLARYANVHPRNVQRSIRRLVDLGEVEALRQTGGLASTPAHERPNLYRVLLRCPPECDRSPQHRVAQMPPPGASATPPGGADATPPVAPVPPEPSLNHPSEPLPTPTVSAQAVVGAWIDWLGQRPPGRVVGQVARLVGELLAEGIEPDMIKSALADMSRRSLNPSVLPSLVHEQQVRVQRAQRPELARDVTGAPGAEVVPIRQRAEDLDGKARLTQRVQNRTEEWDALVGMYREGS